MWTLHQQSFVSERALLLTNYLPYLIKGCGYTRREGVGADGHNCFVSSRMTYHCQILSVANSCISMAPGEKNGAPFFMQFCGNSSDTWFLNIFNHLPPASWPVWCVWVWNQKWGYQALTDAGNSNLEAHCPHCILLHVCRYKPNASQLSSWHWKSFSNFQWAVSDWPLQSPVYSSTTQF